MQKAIIRFFERTVANLIALSVFFAGLFMIFVLGVVGSWAKIAHSENYTLKENSVLHYKLTEAPMLFPDNNKIKNLIQSGKQKHSYSEVHHILKDAAQNPKIVGLVLELGHNLTTLTPGCLARLESYIEEFKKSGKPVVVYSDQYTETTLALASVANVVALHPDGHLVFNGYGTTQLYFKDMLDKYKLNVEVLLPPGNAYKSAVEPYTRNNMSPEAREQLKALLNSFYKKILTNIVNKSSKNYELVEDLADTHPLFRADEALSNNFIDNLCTLQDLIDELFPYLLQGETSRLEEGANEEEETVLSGDMPYKTKVTSYSFEDYSKLITHRDNSKGDDHAERKNSDHILVIPVIGTIDRQEGDDKPQKSATPKHLIKALTYAQNNEDVRAIVLLINSPGGDANASAMIYRKVREVSKEKPIYALIHSVGASGGYFIACGANKIFAESPNTITGSIGAYSLQFGIHSAEKILHNQLQINFDGIHTSRPNQANGQLAHYKRGRIARKRELENIYQDFLNAVKAHTSIKDVHQLGGGRVYTADQAVKKGLLEGVKHLEEVCDELRTTSEGSTQKLSVRYYVDEVSPFHIYLNLISKYLYASTPATTIQRIQKMEGFRAQTGDLNYLLDEEDDTSLTLPQLAYILAGLLKG